MAADSAVQTWWPEVPGRVVDVRFAHSPGRWDPEYTANLRTFDAAFVLDLGDGLMEVVADGDTAYLHFSLIEVLTGSSDWLSMSAADAWAASKASTFFSSSTSLALMPPSVPMPCCWG